MVFEVEEHVLRVERHLDRRFLFEQHAFEQVRRFLGQDESRRQLARLLRGVLHQLVGVGGHERDRRGLDVDVDAVHDRTQFVVGCGEDRLVDTVDERVDVERQLLLVLRERGQRRITHGTGAGNRKRTAFPVEFDLEGLVVAVDRQRNFGELFERVEQLLGGGGDHPFALDVVDGNLPDERGFQIGGGHFQLVALQLHEEIVEDRQRVLIADYFTGGRQQRQKRGT